VFFRFLDQPEEYTVKRYVTLGFSIVASAALGAAAVQAIHAQTKPMGYVIALNVVNDPESYAKECAAVVDKTIVDAGGSAEFPVGRCGGGCAIGRPTSLRSNFLIYTRIHHASPWVL
jgi:hypothetical protein